MATRASRLPALEMPWHRCPSPLAARRDAAPLRSPGLSFGVPRADGTDADRRLLPFDPLGAALVPGGGMSVAMGKAQASSSASRKACGSRVIVTHMLKKQGGIRISYQAIY